MASNDDLDTITCQYHPEANPGPNDSLTFFDVVLAMAETGEVPTVE